MRCIATFSGDSITVACAVFGIKINFEFLICDAMLMLFAGGTIWSSAPVRSNTGMLIRDQSMLSQLRYVFEWFEDFLFARWQKFVGIQCDFEENLL